MANQITIPVDPTNPFDTNKKVTIHTAPNGVLAATLVWALISGEATISPSSDGSTCDIISGSTATSVVVTVTDGVINGQINGDISLAVVNATDLGLTADAPTPK